MGIRLAAGSVEFLLLTATAHCLLFTTRPGDDAWGDQVFLEFEEADGARKAEAFGAGAARIEE